MKRIAFLCALALAGSVAASASDVATPAAAKADRIVGTWQGKLPNGMGGEIRVVLKVQRSAVGELAATMDSPDQNASDIPVAKIALEGSKLTLDVAAVKGSYEATLDAAKDEMSGTWRQLGQEIPLVLKREAAAAR
jgi:opacity protein-like surface antigen